ncbi:MAG: GNAT family N-acetyltransferase [Burkholderiales bacterium]|nr:GNAT family N-acetyltransferase [Burkholderiales bacterium]MCW5604309.1 GNAT family N-acetyltransferase [Burkholderiales bacterium]
MPATPYRLRPADTGDIQEIAVMSRCLIEVGLRGWTWHPARVARALRARETCVLVADVRGRIAGFAITEFGDTRAHLSLFAVKPVYQRRGIGMAMIEWLVESTLTAGIDHFTVEMRANNFAARSFYEALGFRQQQYIAGYYQNVEPAIRMRRDLQQQAAARESNKTV